MKTFAEYLWELIKPGKSQAKRRPQRRGVPVVKTKYDTLVRDMKREYGIRVRKWRSSTTGCAWEVRYHNGEIARMIESPYPKGPVSCAIFLHEVGHHAIGFGRYRPRCLEEFHAWQWAIDKMNERGLNMTDSVKRRMHESLHYAIEKAQRRGLKRLPSELLPFARKDRMSSRQ